MKALLVPTGRAVAAERLRWRRSAAARLPALGLAAAAVQGLLYLAGTVRHEWAALTAWQILWVSFLGPIALGLLAGLLGRRESRARGGGAWWRPITPRRAHVAAFGVLGAYVFALHAMVLVAALPFGWIDGLGFPGPLGDLGLLALVQWTSSLALLALVHQLAARFGPFTALGAGLFWAIAGTLTAESGSWWWQPWAWSVRACLPLIGTHANGIPLELGDALATASPWPPAVLSLALALPIVAYGTRTWRRRASARSTAAPTARTTTGSALRSWRRYGATAALATSLRRTAIAPLIAAAAVLVVAGVLLWTDPGNTLELTALLILPAGATLLPVLVWQASAPAWRVLAARPAGPRRLATVLLMLMGAAVVAFVLFTTAVLILAKLPVLHAVRFGLLAAAVGLLLVAWHFWLAIRAGIGTALAAGAVGTLLALVVGGTGLADKTWPLVPWSWAEAGLPEQRYAVCVPVALILTAVLTVASRQAAQRAAMMSTL